MSPSETMGDSGKSQAIADDRLSALPDGLLHTIMSFMAPWQAVQTCVLSRRWEDLWQSMPCLNIDEPELHRSAVVSDSDTESVNPDEERGCARCEDFVNNLLMFHSAPALDRFRFHFAHIHRNTVFSRWIVRGIRHRPTVLEIHSERFRYSSPHLGYSSRLKRMHLFNIYLDKSITDRLSSACPALEDVNLTFCALEDPKITSCTLKSLTIEHCKSSRGGKVLVIAAPALTCLRLVIPRPCNWSGVVLNEMPYLARAAVHLDYWCPVEDIEEPCKLLCSLINVTDLALSGSETLAILHEEPDTFPVFPNLKTLLLDGCDLSDKLQIFGCFMNSAPGLEKLTLECCQLPEDSRKMVASCEDTITFQCPNLKWTKIKYKEDDAHKLLVLLLGAWKNLQKTTILLEIC